MPDGGAQSILNGFMDARSKNNTTPLRRTTNSNWDTPKAIRPQMAWIAALGLATLAMAWMHAPPWVITIVIIPLTAKAAHEAFRQHRRGINAHTQSQQEADFELRNWQRRWQSLQRQAEQTITALSGMRDGVILLNQKHEILLLNPAAKFLLSLTSGQNYDEREFHEVVRIPKLTRAVDSAGIGDGPQKVLIEVAVGEAIRPVKARIDRFASAGNNNLLITLRDETEAHHLEEIRREFVANISHELKTPLSAIKGYAETVELAIKDDPEAAGYFLAQIQTQCQRLERLIADMMQLARAQSGRSKMRITTVSLTQVIADSIDSCTPVAEAKNIDFSINSPEMDVLVRADYEAALTIANNLISNAIRYTPEHGVVSVSCRAEETCCVLIVKDTGVGITAAEQKRIFERFYRVEKSRSSLDGGTGIGLSVVKNLANALGGEVTVDSHPGSGSTFEVRLPRDTPLLPRDTPLA